MDYPVKTLAQLRPILLGFRKAAGLTQAVVASRLGVTQQTYAQLEADPAGVSVERLFRVLRVLGVELTLAPTVAPPFQSAGAAESVATIRAVKSRTRSATEQALATTTRKVRNTSARKAVGVSKKTENW
jgi:HTH-type transcriptional regulator/antitoxin HipB